MVRRRTSAAIRTIKERAHAWALWFTYHAVLEMIDEDITKEDVQNALLCGSLRARQTQGFRGTRYVLSGPGIDRSSIGIVCRLVGDKVRIITVYRIE